VALLGFPPWKSRSPLRPGPGGSLEPSLCGSARIINAAGPKHAPQALGPAAAWLLTLRRHSCAAEGQVRSAPISTSRSAACGFGSRHVDPSGLAILLSAYDQPVSIRAVP
jgi:hypothetical protein